MTIVGHVQHILVACQIVPVEIQRVERPIGIVGAEDDQLGFMQAVKVMIRVDHGLEFLSRLGSKRCGQIAIGVVMNLVRELAPGCDLMVHLRLHVQHVDHDRRQGCHTRVDGSG